MTAEAALIESPPPILVGDDEYEVFQFLVTRFDVVAAKRLLLKLKKPRKPVLIGITGLAGKVGPVKRVPKEGGFVLHIPLFSINEKPLDQVDTSVPIIAVTLKDGILPIDGLHRIYKALTVENKTELPGYVLTRRETEKVRL